MAYPITLRLQDDNLVLIGRVPVAILEQNNIPYLRSRDEQGRPTFTVAWDTVIAQKLSLHRIPALSRMPKDYTFPMRDAMRPMAHQIQGSDFLVRHKRAYMFLDMGLGKTLTALWALDYLHQIGLISKALVVAPKSILYSAWENEIVTHLPHMTSQVITDDNAARRKAKMHSAAFLHIINHDGPAWFYKDLMKNNYDAIVYDECTAIKNPSTKRFKGVRHLLRSDTILWLMTGTPTPQSPMDAYGQIRLMNNVDADARPCPPAEIIGNAFMTEKAWKHKTMVPGGHGLMWFPRKNANDIIHRYMQPAFCRTKDEVLPDLPRTIFLPPREVTPAKEQEDAYKAFKAKQKAEGTNGLLVDAVNAAVQLSKIIQIGAGCAYAEEFEAGGDTGGKRLIATFPTKAKDTELLEIIEQARGKCIVYAPFTAALHRLYKYLVDLGYRAILIDGSVKPKDVHRLVNVEFQSSGDNSPQIIVAMPQKLSHGITATAATETIWYSPVVRAEVYQQANNRMDRIGQTLQTNVHHLSGSPTEMRLYERLKNNTVSQRELLAMYNAFIEAA